MESVLEKKMRTWAEREQRFREDKVFSKEVLDGPLLKEKLAYFDRLSVQYKPMPGGDRLDYLLLQAERRKLRHKLYPSLFRRLLSGIIAAIITNRQAVKFKTQSEFNHRQLKQSMLQAGFSHFIDKAIDGMKKGRDFTLPVSYYVNGKERMDYELNFKLGNQGEFKFDNYLARLDSGSGTQKLERNFNAGIDAGYNADQAFHLLSGRSVRNNESGGAWQQLDFNDTDGEGNYRFKTFPDQYHKVNYLKLLSNLPHAPGVDVNLGQLLNKMENGEQAVVSLLKDGKANDFNIQINPQYRDISIYDANNKRVDLNSREESNQMQLKKNGKFQQKSRSKRRSQKVS